MVRFLGSSGDVGSVWFFPRETSNPPYASRVDTTSPEAYHTSPEEENPSGGVKYLDLVIVGKALLAQPMLFVKIFFCKDEIQECRGVHKTCCRFEQSQIQIGSERPTDGPRVPMMWTDRVN